MAHHISNTKWQFVWKEVASACLAPAAHPSQRAALAALLHHTFALAGPYHHDRIAGALPPELAAAGLVPAKTTAGAASPLFPPAPPPPAPPAGEGGMGEGAGSAGAGAEGAGEGASSAPPSPPHAPPPAAAPPPPLLELAAGVTARLLAKLPAAEMAAWLYSDAAAAAGVPATTRFLVFAHAALMYGKANLKNVATLFERYAPLLGGAPPASPAALLAAAAAVWARCPHVIPSVAAAAVEAGVARAADAVAFAAAGTAPLAPPFAEDAQHHLLPRAAPAFSAPWQAALFHGALGDAGGRAHRAGVRLAAARGAAVLDDRMMPEELESVAAEKEAALAAAARARRGEYEAAVAAAAGAAAGAAAAAAAAGDAEGVRVALAHLREVLAAHRAAARAGGAGAAARRGAAAGAAAAAVAAAVEELEAGAEAPPRLHVEPPLARDRAQIAPDWGEGPPAGGDDV
jgi:hypothetical protein